jgi:hypothetical protein
MKEICELVWKYAIFFVTLKGGREEKYHLAYLVQGV